jgi:hypothetical protein
MLSRVPPELEPNKNGQIPLDVEDPFERQVTRTLTRALTAVRDAAQELILTGSFSMFQRAVAMGVSANLCDAVAAMGGVSGGAHDLEVSLSWSRLRPLETKEPGRILFPTDTISVIQEAGRVFRETSPREEFELLGVVTKLERSEPGQPGKVTVLGFVDEAPRRLSVELSARDYELAIQAHKEHRLVRCLGQLVKAGRQFDLQEPHRFEFVDEE